MGGSPLKLECESMSNSRKKRLNKIDRYRDKLIYSLDRTFDIWTDRFRQIQRNRKM